MGHLRDGSKKQKVSILKNSIMSREKEVLVNFGIGLNYWEVNESGSDEFTQDEKDHLAKIIMKIKASS